uniref:Uncharacterized protein n=1 Tax=Sciurus vulgaris TaxID=55149 RepID=A0A8D2DKZ4_SCIVU
MSNIEYEWFNQGFILEVRKMAVVNKLLQSITWACHWYLKDFFQVDHTLLLPASHQHEPYCLNTISFISVWKI